MCACCSATLLESVPPARQAERRSQDCVSLFQRPSCRSTTGELQGQLPVRKEVLAGIIFGFKARLRVTLVLDITLGDRFVTPEQRQRSGIPIHLVGNSRASHPTCCGCAGAWALSGGLRAASTSKPPQPCDGRLPATAVMCTAPLDPCRPCLPSVGLFTLLPGIWRRVRVVILSALDRPEGLPLASPLAQDAPRLHAVTNRCFAQRCSSQAPGGLYHSPQDAGHASFLSEHNRRLVSKCHVACDDESANRRAMQLRISCPLRQTQLS